MKFLDLLMLLLLIIVIALGTYVIWLNLPVEPISYEESYLNNTSIFSFSNTAQFYPNMRYKDKAINYYISNSCSAKQRLNALRAFSILSEKTILEFSNNQDAPEIRILCSNISPAQEEEGHFIAGEGGPSEIINVTQFSVILSGKVSLYRDSNCENPNIALHEILHALGFDHNNNKNSIMYPLTQCDQIIDQYLIDEINRLYKIESASDLAIEKLSANKTGRYLNFELTLSNLGLRPATSSLLIITSEGEFVKEFDLGFIDIGNKKILTAQNLRVPRNAEIISFEIKSNEPEISKDNNKADVRFVST